MKTEKILKQLCHIGIYIFLFFFVGIYSFYAPEGYLRLAVHKYYFFRKMCLYTADILIPLVILHCITSWQGKNFKAVKTGLSLTDIFVLLFLAANILSFFFTDYKEEALWGSAGWYMGLIIHFYFAGIYFMISRLYDGKIDLLPFFMGITGIVFLWGLLNRFSVYPIDMHYDDPYFISCMGHINWLCGYWSVFFVIGTVLYIFAKKRSLRIISGIYSALSLSLGVVEGSDSAYISMGVVFFFLYLISFQKTEYIKRWLEEGIIICGCCQIMRMINISAQKGLSHGITDWEGLNMVTPAIKLMLGNLTLAGLAFFVLLRLLLEHADRKHQTGILSQENPSEVQLIQKFIWLKYGVIVLTAVLAIAYLILLIINTNTQILPAAIAKSSLLLFDGSWGSNRGTTWRDGLMIYWSFPLKERLIGAGPDCFSIYAYNVPELEAVLRSHWPKTILPNAHNECITYLVNLGIFGLLTFIGILGSSVKRLLKTGQKEPLCYIFAASLLSYFFHNQFSFAQVLNTPFLFMMLGLGENLMRNMKPEKNL